MGSIWGFYKDNGKENGNYYGIMGSIWGFYRDNGKENGNYYSIMGFIWGLYSTSGLPGIPLLKVRGLGFRV